MSKYEAEITGEYVLDFVSDICTDNDKFRYKSSLPTDRVYAVIYIKIMNQIMSLRTYLGLCGGIHALEGNTVIIRKPFLAFIDAYMNDMKTAFKKKNTIEFIKSYGMLTLAHFADKNYYEDITTFAVDPTIPPSGIIVETITSKPLTVIAFDVKKDDNFKEIQTYLSSQDVFWSNVKKSTAELFAKLLEKNAWSL